MDTKKLRQKILDLAIRGKLVPQDPNDEPASVLLERIRAEKERLIAEGKIKRPKKSKAPSGASHYQQFTPPFEIPDSWEWVRLGEICAKFSTGPFGSTLHKSDYCCDGIPLINPTNITNGTISIEKIERVKPEMLPSLTRYVLMPNDIVLARRGNLSKCAVISTNEDGWLCGTGSFFLSVIGLNTSLFYYIYTSSYAQKYLEEDSVGATMNNLNQSLLANLAIPLPPIQEQSRIIKQIEQWFNTIDGLESNRATLLNLLNIVKSKILDLAMQGKLVAQDPMDEPAADMLMRINPKAKIITDSPHYEQLPDNWVITKLGDAVMVITGKKQREVENPSGAYPIYGSGGIIGMADTYSCLSGSTIIGRKGTINSPLFIETNFWNVDTAFGMKPCEAVNDLYFYYFCKSFDFTSLDKSSTLPSLTKSAIEGISMPIPPLGEQHRIILKIREYDNLFRNIIKQIG